ncbi:carboxymuconolactone decarboxylase family protein [Streptomyces sp. SID8361]|uniref:carboxymuconolactone decarboxylase family protein n=1 Tax=Streptomyces sp. MnatMP-M27 TaxID=1839768 RepID=UPI00144DB403|nr:carboxymuconolactone decarboxylase family protein [Streptomyces sp. MnatMP-M27]MYU11165.1 carboxymuconolactone decarboxylase family protein [Streptomyces sp. SID8361]
MDVYRSLVRDRLGEEIPDGAFVRNVARTWAHHPDLMAAQRPLQKQLVGKGVLPPRERELAILRIGWRCGSEYEFGQHSRIGQRAGLTESEVRRVAVGPGDPGWGEFDALILTAVDELFEQHGLSDTTWTALTSRYDTAAMIEFVSLVGRYWTVSVVLNTLGVQLEPGTEGFPP